MREERQQFMEEVLAELKEVLKEVQEQREVAEERCSREGVVRARLRNLCREALATAIANTKQDLVKVCNVSACEFHTIDGQLQYDLQPSSSTI